MTGITHTEDVTPSNTVDLQHECSAIYVGTGGDVAGVETNGGVSLYKNVPSGAYIYGIFRRVNATGTNAADMIASRGLVPFVHSAAKTSITEWNAATTYYIDDVRLHNGGIWSSNTTNTDSEPISGNADWTLIGGTPYVTVPISTAQIRTLASLSVEIIPAPGENLIAIHEKYVARSSLATQDFSSGISLLLRWKNAPNNDPLSLNAQFGIGFSPFVGAGNAWSDAFSGGVPLYDASDPSNSTVNSAIELASSGDVTDGDSTLLLTVWYNIVSAT